MQDQRICPHCSEPFVVDRDYPGRKFCSRTCAYANRKARSHIERVCRSCGETFMAKGAEVRRRGGMYCSRACWRANPPRVGSSPEMAERMRVERRGAGNPAYRGDAITFGAAHDRVRAVRGRAAEHACIGCGETAKDWALSRDAEATRVAPNGRRYSLDVEDYAAMCRTCHVRYDKRGG